MASALLCGRGDLEASGLQSGLSIFSSVVVSCESKGVDGYAYRAISRESVAECCQASVG